MYYIHYVLYTVPVIPSVNCCVSTACIRMYIHIIQCNIINLTQRRWHTPRNQYIYIALKIRPQFATLFYKYSYFPLISVTQQPVPVTERFKSLRFAVARLLGLRVRIPPGGYRYLSFLSVIRHRCFPHNSSHCIGTSPRNYIDSTKSDSIVSQICGAQDSVMLYVLFT
jgi:hypothetical protein